MRSELMTYGSRLAVFQLDHLSNVIKKDVFHIIYHLRVFLSVFHPVGRYRSIFFPLFYSNYFTYFYQGKSDHLFINCLNFFIILFFLYIDFRLTHSLFHLLLFILFINHFIIYFILISLIFLIMASIFHLFLSGKK